MSRVSRDTIQKETLDLLSLTETHFFDAKTLLERIKKQDSKISRATIFRYLKDSVKRGKLHSFQCGGATIYSSNHKNHCHFLCEGCGKVEHITIEDLSFLKQFTAKEICHVQIDISGHCPRCLQQRS